MSKRWWWWLTSVLKLASAVCDCCCSYPAPGLSYVWEADGKIDFKWTVMVTEKSVLTGWEQNGKFTGETSVFYSSESMRKNVWFVVV